MFRTTRRKLVLVAGLVVTLALGGIAFAFWTTTGAGTGSGTVGTSTALVLHGTAPTLLYPGTSSVVNFTVDNSNTGAQTVTTIHLDSVSTDAAHSTCVTTDFTMPDVASGQNFAGSTNGQAVTATGTLTMANTLLNQDACKNAPLTLHLSSI